MSSKPDNHNTQHPKSQALTDTCTTGTRHQHNILSYVRVQGQRFSIGGTDEFSTGYKQQFSTGNRQYLVFARVYKNHPVENYYTFSTGYHKVVENYYTFSTTLWKTIIRTSHSCYKILRVFLSYQIFLQMFVFYTPGGMFRLLQLNCAKWFLIRPTA